MNQSKVCAECQTVETLRRALNGIAEAVRRYFTEPEWTSENLIFTVEKCLKEVEKNENST